MKKMRLILLALTLSTVGYSQQKLEGILPLQNGKVGYTAVVKIDSVTRDELYRRAKRWIVRTCDSSYLGDQEELIGKRQFISGTTEVWQTISFQAKEGRYSYTITDFHTKSMTILQSTFVKHHDTPLEDAVLIGKKAFFKEIDIDTKKLILSLEKSMKIPLDNNW